MLRLVLFLLIVAGPGGAQQWQKLDGAAIAIALNDRSLDYSNATQSFYADGRTLYTARSPSWGTWRVTGDQYCSLWPPSDIWACYDLERDEAGALLRFIASDGGVTQGVYTD
jgi:hypothetical protein